MISKAVQEYHESRAKRENGGDINRMLLVRDMTKLEIEIDEAQKEVAVQEEQIARTRREVDAKRVKVQAMQETLEKHKMDFDKLDAALHASVDKNAAESECAKKAIATHFPNVFKTPDEYLRARTQRLLLLRHSSYCAAQEGRCIATQHCDLMKKVWKHILVCTDGQCTFDLCLSSKYAMHHYIECRSSMCTVCKPVRHAQENRLVEEFQGYRKNEYTS